MKKLLFIIALGLVPKARAQTMPENCGAGCTTADGTWATQTTANGITVTTFAPSDAWATAHPVTIPVLYNICPKVQDPITQAWLVMSPCLYNGIPLTDAQRSSYTAAGYDVSPEPHP